MRCGQCGHEVPDVSTFCNACGAQIQRPVGYPPGPPPGYAAPHGAHPPPGAHAAPGPRGTSGMAIAGFILSFFCGLLGLIFSIMGYNEVKRSEGRLGGEGLAMAGIVISIVSMLIGLGVAVSR